MLMARWASDVVLRYIRDAPLKGLTSDYIRRAAAASAASSTAYTLHGAMNAISLDTRRALVDRSVEYQSLEDRLTFLQQRLDELSDKMSAPRFACKTVSGVMHRADVSLMADTLVHRCTPCGWRYGVHNSTRHTHLPQGIYFRLVCSRCLPAERSELSSRSVACSDSSSSSTEESA